MDNTYSRFIFLAKVLLPLAALILLSTIFMLSRSVDPTASIPYASVDVEQLARDQGVSAPTYSTLAEDGTAITFSAARVLPGTDDIDSTRAEEIHLRMEHPDGGETRVVSTLGRLDSPNDQALLEGGVRIVTSDGYEMATQTLLADMAGAWLESESDVTMTGPLGTISAGQMRLHQSETAPGHHVVDFQGGVKVIYTPQPEGNAQ